MKTIGFKIDGDTAARLRLATGGRGQSAALRRAMAEAVVRGTLPARAPAAVGEAAPLITLTLRVSDELAEQWTRVIGPLSSSAALRAIASSVTRLPVQVKAGRSFVPRPLPELPAVPRAERATVTLHLASELHAELARAAQTMGVTPARWAAAWLSARLSGHPSFAGHDADSIRQVANQLAAIGRNINAIARAMNVEAAKSRMRDNQVAAVAEMAAEVLVFRKQVVRLASDQLAFWTGDA